MFPPHPAPSEGTATTTTPVRSDPVNRQHAILHSGLTCLRLLCQKFILLVIITAIGIATQINGLGIDQERFSAIFGILDSHYIFIRPPW
jgi:hypothetical protein